MCICTLDKQEAFYFHQFHRGAHYAKLLAFHPNICYHLILAGWNFDLYKLLRRLFFLLNLKFYYGFGIRCLHLTEVQLSFRLQWLSAYLYFLGFAVRLYYSIFRFRCLMNICFLENSLASKLSNHLKKYKWPAHCLPPLTTTFLRFLFASVRIFVAILNHFVPVVRKMIYLSRDYFASVVLPLTNFAA